MTNSAHTIAVVVVNYNSGQYLTACIDSIYTQSEAADRVIVVDNNSDDGSVDLVSQKYPHIQLIRESRNIGFAAANNLALELIDDCDWVVLINPDATASPDLIQLLRAAVEEHPEAQMFSCRLLDANDKLLLDGTGDRYHVSGLGWRRDHGASVSRSRDITETIFSPCGAAALYNIQWVRRAGCFDETYFCYNEDTDLAFRMRLLGANCLHLDHCVVNHVGSGISGSDSDFTVYHGHRNLVWTYIKNMPQGMLWWYLPQHILLNLITIIYYSLKGRPGVIFRAKWHAILGLPRVIRQRSKIQESRRIPDQQLRKAMVTNPLAPYFRRDE